MLRKYRSRTERGRLFLALDGKCHLCKGRINASTGEAWDIEHVIPLANGGADDDSNLGLSHKKCHREKTTNEAPLIAKTERIRLKHIGAVKPRGNWPKKQRRFA